MGIAGTPTRHFFNLPANQTSVQKTVVIPDPIMYPYTKTFNVSLSRYPNSDHICIGGVSDCNERGPVDVLVGRPIWVWGTILFGEIPQLILPDTVEVTEGSSTSLDVRLSTVPIQDVTVLISGYNRTDLDTTASTPRQLTFSASESEISHAITLGAKHDADYTNEIVELIFDATRGGDTETSDTIYVRILDDDLGGLVVTPNQVSVPEGGTASFEVSLTAMPPVGETVTVMMDGYAGSDLDTTASAPRTLRFDSSNYSDAKPVTISAKHDDDFVDDSVELTVTVSGGGYGEASKTVDVTIKDDDMPYLVVSTNTVRVPEGGTASFEVSLTAMPPVGETVTVMMDGYAGSDLDTTASAPRTLRFNSSNYSDAKTVTISAKHDDDFADDSVQLDIQASGGGYDDTDMVNVTIMDDDSTPVEATIHVSKEEVNEGDDVEVVIYQSDGFSSPTTIGLNYTNISAESGDYEPIYNVNIGSGETERRFTITTIADADTDSEQFTVALGSLPSGMVAGDPSSKTITIREPHPPPIRPQVDLSAIKRSAVEGEPLRIMAELSQTWHTSVEIPLTVTQGSATEPDDFEIRRPAYIEISSASTSGTYEISTIPDDIAEGDEEFIVAIDIQRISSDLDIGNSTVELTITDDDEIGIDAPPSVQVAEGQFNSIDVKLHSMPTSTVELTIHGYTHPDLEIAPQDLRFTPEDWDKSQQVHVTFNENNQIDSDREELILSATGGGYTGESHTVIVTLSDNDSPEMDAPETLFIQEGATENFNVTLSAEPTQSVQITFSAHDDLTPAPLSLTIQANEWNRPHPVSLTAESDDDYDSEVISFELTASDGGYDGITHTIEVTIEDNTEQPLRISIQDHQAFEQDGSIHLAVELNRPTDEVVTVQYATFDDSAKEGEDYTASRGIVIFDPNATSGVVQIAINPDEIDEGDETFFVRLSNPSPSHVEIIREVGTATIKDQNQQAYLQIIDVWVDASESVVEFQVRISEPQPVPVPVHYQTYDRTAKAGKDYQSQQGIVTIAPGLMETVIVIPLLKNGINWLRESFAVHVTSSSDVQIHKAVGVATIQEATDSDQKILLGYATRFIRTASVQVTEALGQRFRSGQDMAVCAADDQAQRVQLWSTTSPWNPTLGELLSGCHISRSITTSNARFGVWGRGAFRRFNGRGDDALSIRGDVTTGMLGADYQWKTMAEEGGHWLVGILLAHSQSSGSFRLSDQSGDLKAHMTGFYPYVSYRASSWHAWMSGGYGWGDATMQKEEEDQLVSRFGAIGLRAHLASTQSVHFAYHGDVLFTDAKMASYTMRGEAVRIRVGLEGAFQMWEGVHPYLEANVRQDGGDTESGIGMELSGGVRIDYPAWQLKGDVRSHGLIMHTADDFTEWGLSGAIQVGRRSDGFMVVLRPSWGPRQTSGLHQQQTILDVGPAHGGTHQTDLEVGYGRPWRSGDIRSVIGVTQFSSSRLFRVGGELRPWNQVSFSVSALGHQDQSNIGSLGVNLQGSMHY